MAVSPTIAESLLIKRRRAGLTQEDMARYQGVSLGTYLMRERAQGGEVDSTLNPPLKVHEACLLLRRRSRRTQQFLAQALSLSVEYIRMMEHGKAPCTHLAEYWGLNEQPSKR